jgi:hypothetical protein
MLRWTQATLNRGELDGNRILEASSYDQIWASVIDTLWGGGAYDSVALGWFTGAIGDRTFCAYWGSDVGTHAACQLCLDEQAGAVAMGNQFTAVNFTSAYANTLVDLAMNMAALA